MMAEITRRMQDNFNRAQQANDNLVDIDAGQERVAAVAGARRARLEVIGSMVSKLKMMRLMKVMMSLKLVSTAGTITADGQLIT
ncbi:hypothetical protein Bca101_059388 [Brassica carinata]